MELKDILFNDNLAQFYRSYHLTNLEKERRIKEISSCNHLFLLTDNLECECIYCGLSNRTLNVYLKLSKFLQDSKYQKIFNQLPFEGSLFLNSYPNNLFNPNFNDFNLISPNIIKTYHAKILYQIAREINRDCSLEEIYEIMCDLNDLETDFERVKIKTTLDAFNLIKRYKMQKSYKK